MISALKYLPVFLLFYLLASPPVSAAELPQLTPDQSQWLGNRIYLNECNAEVSCLTAWNAGEEFPSLGIGHFIWYGQGQSAPFEETFPDLMQFMQSQGLSLPTIVTDHDFESPWSSREAFLAQLGSAPMVELRNFLAAHKIYQAEFIIERLHASVTDIISQVPADQREVVENRIENLAASNPPQGLYALIDYVHFKGTGLNDTEQYEGQGWGLLQVLTGMQKDQDELAEFVASARRILENRVRNSPPDRNETRWLQGWFNRLDTYLVEPVVQ